MHRVTDSNSSFTQDVTRMTRVCHSIQNRSLLFIDEFGKGTHPEDGVSLFLSLTHYLSSLSFQDSFFFLSTHFSDYLTEELLDAPLSSFTLKRMNVLLNEDEHHMITPLYQVVDGVCEDSLGIRVAAALGVPESIIKRAEIIYECIHTNKVIAIEEELNQRSKMKGIEKVIAMVFEMPDWDQATDEELRSLLDLLNSLQ